MSYRTDKAEWIEGLQIGDRALVSGRFGGLREMYLKRTTKTQLAFSNGRGEEKFWKKDGSQVGGDAWRWSTLNRPTEELEQRLITQKLTKKAQYLRKNLCVPETKEALVNFIAAIEPLIECEEVSE